MTGDSVPLAEHLAAIEIWRDRYEAERDRRYTEVNVERSRALSIKEVADLTALQLAREIQTYKDEKANELREQINSERGLYATKDDVIVAVEKMEAAMQPLASYITSLQVARAQHLENSGNIKSLTTIVISAAGLILAMLGFIATRLVS